MEIAPATDSGGRLTSVHRTRCPPAEPPVIQIFLWCRPYFARKASDSTNFAAATQSSPQAGHGFFAEARRYSMLNAAKPSSRWKNSAIPATPARLMALQPPPWITRMSGVSGRTSSGR